MKVLFPQIAFGLRKTRDTYYKSILGAVFKLGEACDTYYKLVLESVLEVYKGL